MTLVPNRMFLVAFDMFKKDKMKQRNYLFRIEAYLLSAPSASLATCVLRIHFGKITAPINK